MIEQLVKIIHALWNVMSRAYYFRETVESMILFSDPENVRNESVYEHKARLLAFYVKFVDFVQELDDVKMLLERLRTIAEDDKLTHEEIVRLAARKRGNEEARQKKHVPPPEATFIVNGKNVGTKLGAIKAVRELRPTWSLEESKDFVDKFALQQYSVDLSAE